MQNYMYLFATNKSLQVIIIHLKIDTIQYLNIKAKNVKGNTPGCSGRDSIKGSSYFHNGLQS